MVPGVEIGNDFQKCVPSLPAPFDVSWKWPQVWRHCGWALIRVLHSYSCCKHYQEPFCAPESLLLLITTRKKKKVSFFLADAFYWVWIKLLWLSTFYEMNKGMILAKVFLYSCHMLFVRLISIAVTVTYSRSTGSLFSRFHLFWCDLFLCRQLAVTDCSAHCCPSLLGHLCRESLAWVCTSIKETIPASETESPLKQSRVNKKRIIIYIYC